jgi:hydrogenase small subunit
LGALAAAAGLSQAEISRLAEAVAYGNPGLGGTFGKPRVVWIHGAECTGCSTSVLGTFEDLNGRAIEGTEVTTAQALTDAGMLPTQHSSGGLLLHQEGFNVEGTGGTTYDSAVNIADVVVDVVDILYHETIMGMGSDLAYQWLDNFQNTNTAPFVLVVEGALQNIDVSGNDGAWGDTTTDVPWCSIGMNEAGTLEHDMPEVVQTCAELDSCLAVIGIGQCATFGGYPGCKSPLDTATAGFDTSKSQTGALGTFDYLTVHSTAEVAGKVVNVPGCPTNPWWFVLTVVCFLIDFNTLGANDGDQGQLKILERDSSLATTIKYVGSAVDSTRRLRYVYGTPIHGPYCDRYGDYTRGFYASKPGDPGCLQMIGCKGPGTTSLCGMHGWNGQQPQNPTSWDYYVGAANPNDAGGQRGGHCTRAGHPCMACTEKGYPDSFVPFVVRS